MLHSPFLVTLVLMSADTPDTCLNYIATSEKVYCLTSRGTPSVEPTEFGTTEDATPFGDSAVSEDGEAILDTVQYHDEGVIIDDTTQP